MGKNKKLCIILLRLLALGTTLSAAIVMATSKESTTVLNLTFDAKYDNSPTFVFFVVANGIASAYTLLVIFLPSNGFIPLIIVALDVIVTLLLTSSISATLAIAYVGKKGNTHAGWLPICDQVPNFCNQVTGGVIAGIAGLVIYMMVLLHSIHSVLNPLLF
ncbi:Casparian strip membrane protein [Thalictrum thalictroides]|uniref:CASP-like protein n=1 Tax=Thalictrum thalictroides TaxID=46969 RepID=A0A7J6UYG5_THATH|nr:Casparian strip membrane protein [Thalictrum thalictroides]